jgi:hypothetical protein
MAVVYGAHGNLHLHCPTIPQRHHGLFLHGALSISFHLFFLLVDHLSYYQRAHTRTSMRASDPVLPSITCTETHAHRLRIFVFPSATSILFTTFPIRTQTCLSTPFGRLWSSRIQAQRFPNIETRALRRARVSRRAPACFCASSYLNQLSTQARLTTHANTHTHTQLPILSVRS